MSPTGSVIEQPVAAAIEPPAPSIPPPDTERDLTALAEPAALEERVAPAAPDSSEWFDRPSPVPEEPGTVASRALPNPPRWAMIAAAAGLVGTLAMVVGLSAPAASSNASPAVVSTVVTTAASVPAPTASAAAAAAAAAAAPASIAEPVPAPSIAPAPPDRARRAPSEPKVAPRVRQPRPRAEAPAAPPKGTGLYARD